MLEVLKEFLLFGVVENFIILMWFYFMMEIKQVKMWHIVPISTLCIISCFIVFPFGKQIFGIIIFLLYLFIICKNIKRSIISTISGFLFLLCSEAIICVVLEIVFGIILSDYSTFEKLKFILSIRFVEVFIILFYYIIKTRRLIIWDIGGGVK